MTSKILVLRMKFITGISAENLMYNEKEVQSFIHFYKTLDNNSLFFQEAINYLSAICTDNNIDPYKILIQFEKEKTLIND
jgi:hypothetical protein